MGSWQKQVADLKLRKIVFLNVTALEAFDKIKTA